jgi:hypothetical protein
MKKEYNFDWRGEIMYPVITSIIFKIFSRKDPVAGLRPFGIGAPALVLLESEVMFFSKDIHPAAAVLLRILLKNVEPLDAGRSGKVAPPRDPIPSKRARKRRALPVGRPAGIRRGMTICIIDSGLDAAVTVKAEIVHSISLVDDHPRKDFNGHGTKVVSSMCGWRHGNRDDSNGHAQGAKLLIAKVYGASVNDTSIRPELIEIAIAWAQKHSTDLIVACVGAYRSIGARSSTHGRSITRLLRQRSAVKMFASAGLGEERSSTAIGIMEPAAANLVASIAAWDNFLGQHPPNGAISDDYARILFSGNGYYCPSIYARYPVDSAVPTVVRYDFKGASAACAVISSVYAAHYRSYCGTAGGADRVYAVLSQMQLDCWRSSNWDCKRGGYGIPNAPKASAASGRAMLARRSPGGAPHYDARRGIFRHRR